MFILETKYENMIKIELHLELNGKLDNDMKIRKLVLTIVIIIYQLQLSSVYMLRVDGIGLRKEKIIVLWTHL